MTDALLTPEELSGWLKIPIRTIYGWRYRGASPRAIVVGRHLRYRQREVEEWLDGQMSERGH